MELFLNLLFVCPMLFVAGIIDSISGGGGIIALPAYLLTGMPVSFAYGCNKLQSCIGTSIAAVRYAKAGYVDFRTSAVCAIPAIMGAFFATQIMLRLSDASKSIIIVGAMVFIIALTLVSSYVKAGDIKRLSLSFQNIALMFVVGILLGLYDGFFGPGGGTVAIMLFCIIFKYDMRCAGGNGKIIVVVSNLIGLITYALKGCIIYEIAIPATICNTLGCYIGAGLAVKGGRKLIKKFIFCVVVFVIIQALIKLS